MPATAADHLQLHLFPWSMGPMGEGARLYDKGKLVSMLGWVDSWVIFGVACAQWSFWCVTIELRSFWTLVGADLGRVWYCARRSASICRLGCSTDLDDGRHCSAMLVDRGGVTVVSLPSANPHPYSHTSATSSATHIFSIFKSRTTDHLFTGPELIATQTYLMLANIYYF